MSATGQSSYKDFNDWWQRTGEWVEAPNQRRGGESGVQRLAPVTAGQPWLYSKRQIGHRFISWRYPLGRPTVLREKNAMQALQRLGVQVPKLVFYAAEKRDKDWHAFFSEKARRRWPAHRAALHDIKQFGRHRGQMPDTDWQLFLQYYCNLNPKLRTKLA